MATGKFNLFSLAVIPLGLLLTNLVLAAADLPSGKPLIQTTSIVAGQGLAQNWAVQQAPDGLLYVGGGSSLLEFDGVNWRSIKTLNDGRVRDLQIDTKGRIWVASPGEFNYFSRGPQGQLVYHSVSQQLPEEQRDFGETRFVHLLGDQVYFNTYERIFRWSNDELTSFDNWDGLFRLTFVANERYYVAVKDRIYDLTEFPDGASPPAPVGVAGKHPLQH